MKSKYSIKLKLLISKSNINMSRHLSKNSLSVIVLLNLFPFLTASTVAKNISYSIR